MIGAYHKYVAKTTNVIARFELERYRCNYCTLNMIGTGKVQVPVARPSMNATPAMPDSRSLPHGLSTRPCAGRRMFSFKWDRIGDAD